MPSLRSLQQAFVDAVFVPGASTAFIAGTPDEAADRIGVYRRTIFANYRNALAATYPVVQRMVGAGIFRSAVDAFVAEHPSTCGDLNVYGDRFGDFLDRYAPAAQWSHLGDIARLEWAIDDAHRAGDAKRDPQAVLSALAAVQPERLTALRLELDPSCRLVVSSYPVLRLWKINQPDRAAGDRVSPDEGGDVLLVRRDPHGVALERLAPGDHAWLAALAKGDRLGDAIDAAQAADPTFDLGTSLREHIAAGTIVSIVDE